MREILLGAKKKANIESIYVIHGMKFYCPTETAKDRSQEMFSKEPQTIAWIEGFGNGDVLWDIGANIGTFSLYAAHLGHKVVAFEPAPSNYYVLCRNVELNKLDVAPYCVALSDVTKVGTLFMVGTHAGGAGYSFGSPVDYRGLAYEAKWEQPTISFRVDDFVKLGAPFPNHIKLDVDGIEPSVLMGALETLRDHRLKSIMIEAFDFALVKTFLWGFEVVSTEKKTGITNYICRRRDAH